MRFKFARLRRSAIVVFDSVACSARIDRGTSGRRAVFLAFVETTLSCLRVLRARSYLAQEPVDAIQVRSLA